MAGRGEGSEKEAATLTHTRVHSEGRGRVGAREGGGKSVQRWSDRSRNGCCAWQQFSCKSARRGDCCCLYFFLALSLSLVSFLDWTLSTTQVMPSSKPSPVLAEHGWICQVRSRMPSRPNKSAICATVEKQQRKPSQTLAAESGQCTAGALYLQFWRRERSTSPACWQTQGEGHLPACRPREACPAPGQPQSRRASCQHCLPRTAAQRCVREGCRERERRHQRRPNCECCAGCSTDEGVLVGALTRASVPS